MKMKKKNYINAKLIKVHVNDPHAGKMSMMMDSAGHDFTEEEIRERDTNRNDQSSKNDHGQVDRSISQPDSHNLEKNVFTSACFAKCNKRVVFCAVSNVYIC